VRQLLLACALVCVPALAHAQTTKVVIQTDDPRVVLESRAQSTDPWRVVCGRACNAPLPTHATYRFSGDGIRSSPAFELAPKGDSAILHVETRPKGAFIAGAVLTSVGAASLGAATAAVAFAVFTKSGATGAFFNVGAFVVFGVCTVLGLGTLIPGLIMLSHNSATFVESR
jgi:hypothetical protein